MRFNARCRGWALLGLVLLAGREVSARSAPPTTDLHKLVQAPTLQAPRRGTLAGSLSAASIGINDVTRGAFSLPFPVTLPTERGKPLVEVLPHYRPEQGQSAWGLGWGANLALERTTMRGEVAFDESDLLQSPWGPLTRGEGGAYYPVGLTQPLRVVQDAKGWEARDQVGTRYRFVEQAGTGGPHGVLAWHLTEAKTLTGATTKFSYTVLRGTAYLSQVLYGGPGGRDQVQVVLRMAAVPKATMRYIAGRAAWLDQRVQSITVRMRQQDDSWADQRVISLTHAFDSHGPAFTLQSVQVSYPDGSREPAVTYQHAGWGESLRAAVVEANPALQTYLDIKGVPQAGVITPDWSTLADLDDDGQLDIERPYDFQAFRGTANGFVPMSPATKVGNPDPDCWLPPGQFNLTRPLVRLRPEDSEVRVIDLQAVRAQSQLKVCDRGGQLLSRQVLDGAWEFGPLIRLADLDRDLLPDLVRLQPGGVTIRRNISTGTGYAFSGEIEQRLEPRLEPDAFWVHDMNGDGIADLVAATVDGIWVWYGKGRMVFEAQAHQQAFRNNGLPHLPTHEDEIYFVDANHDGLTDVLLLEDRTYPELFINSGTTFDFVDVPALASIPAHANQYVLADLSGSGNTELSFTVWDEAKRVALDSPDTALLKHVDDGRGNTWTLSYGRAAPQPGAGPRPAVLSKVTVAVAGEAAQVRRFHYEHPVRHGVGRQLLGYEGVVADSGRLHEEANYTFQTDTPPVPTRVARADVDRHANPVGVVTETDYVPDNFRGIPYLRRVKERSSSDDAHSLQRSTNTTAYSSYANPWCPLRVVTTNDNGTLTHARTLATPASLIDVPHCLESEERWVGKHADPSLDFDVGTKRTRNMLGLVTQVYQAPKVLLQAIEYDSVGRPIRLAAPGQGQTTLAYGTDGALSAVTGSDGVVMRADYNPVSNLLEALETRRDGAAWVQQFSYDPLGRLSATWDNVSGTTARSPRDAYSYAFATTATPGMVQHRTLVEGQGSRLSIELLDGKDGLLGKGTLGPAGWHLDEVQLRDPDRGTESARMPDAALQGMPPEQWTFAALSHGATQRGSIERDGLGRARVGASSVTEAVSQVETRSYAVDGLLWTSTSLGGWPANHVGTNSAGSTAVARDQAGYETQFTYDALDRLRRIKLADSALHLVEYDARGRLVRSQRRGLACLEHAYVRDKNLLLETSHGDGDCKPIRRTRFTYDGIGRVLSETHLAAKGGAHEAIEFTYDGRQPGGGRAAGQLGFLTGISTRDVKKTLTYAPDGAQVAQEIDFAGWRRLLEWRTLHADRSLACTRRELLDAAGHVVAATTRSQHTDRYGRLAFASQGNDILYRVDHDAQGRPIALRLADGEEVAATFDPLTDALVGVRHATLSKTWEQRFEFDARGDVVNTEAWQDAGRQSRILGYDARDFLTSVDSMTRYTYDAVGRAQSPSAHASAPRDSVGRQLQAHGYELAYGPGGSLATLTGRGATQATWAFSYDEAQKRVLERYQGHPVAGRTDDLLVTDDSIVEVLRLGRLPVGLLRNGVPTLLAADAMGTVLVDGGGDLAVPSPFGVRDAPSYAPQAIEFGGGPRTGNTPLIRLGTRDYDPGAAEFTTPDTALLQDPSLCVLAPDQCNLFSYAKNNPLRFDDPSGNFVQALGAAAAAAAEGGAITISAGELGLVITAYVAAHVAKWSAPPDLQTRDPMRFNWYMHLASQGIYAGYIGPLEPSGGARMSREIAMRPDWPACDGFEAGKSYWMHLLPGTLVDRYGRESGNFFAHVGAPFESRALPDRSRHADLWQYEVLKPILVRGGYAADWFGYPGGAPQYKTDLSAAELVDQKYLRRIRNANP